jgi:hypothetical protein
VSGITGSEADLLGLVVIAALGMVYFLAKGLRGNDVQEVMLWLRHNYSGTMIKVKSDLQGVFLTVVYGFLGGKKETIQNSAKPIEVEIAVKGEAHLLERPKSSAPFTEALQAPLKALGYSITPYGKKKDKLGFRGYILKEPDSVQRAKAYVDVTGSRRMRLHAGIEGLGETVDLLDFHAGIDAARTKATNSNAVVLHEMKMAVKAFLQMLAESLKGTVSSFLMPLVLGISVGAMISFLLLLVTGHLKA